MTVDRVHVLATPGMDSHSSYVCPVATSRSCGPVYGRDDFADPNRLARTLSRDRAKDMASDYDQADPAQADPARSYAERRGIFDGLRLSAGRHPAIPMRRDRKRGRKVKERMWRPRRAARCGSAGAVGWP